MRISNKLFTTYLISIVVLGLLGCRTDRKEQTENVSPAGKDVLLLSEIQEKNAGIKLGKVLCSNQARQLKVYGKTFFPPENIVTVTSLYGGSIKSIGVMQGQQVSTGQVIALLEDPRFVDLQQDYLLTKSKLKLVELDYTRQRDLNEAKASSDKVYQMAENEFRTNQIMLKSLSEKLKLLGINPEKLTQNTITRTIPIRSTTNGLISKVYANKGKYLTPSESIVDIIQQTSPYLRLKLYEKDLNFIHKDMFLVAHSAIDTSIQYRCRIRNINPEVGADGATEVICSFLNPRKTLPQNMHLIAFLELSNQQTITLPNEAIVDFEGQSFVFLKMGQHQYKMMPILKGSTNAQQTEILNSEELEGKDIVVKGAYTLLMALRNRE